MKMSKSSNKLYVFVLMPFSKEFDDIYQLGIKSVCEELGMYCERVDETHVLGPIYDKIINSITKADIVIADLTGRNPNVFYEAGYAHALSKITIHLCQEVKEIPFDLLGFQHIIYSGRIVDLKSNLKSKLEWAKEYIETKGEEIAPISFDFYSSGKEITEQITTELKKVFTPDGIVGKVQTEFQIDILNTGVAASQSLGPVYVYTSDMVSTVYNPREGGGESAAIFATSEVEDYQRRHQVDFKQVFAAGEWKSLPIRLQLTASQNMLDKDNFEIPIRIRFLTESTPLDLDTILAAQIFKDASPVSFIIAQNEHPTEIAVKPEVEYERDGRIDEAGFQVSVAIKNLSDKEQQIGPLHVYTNNSVIKFEASTSGMFIMGRGGSYHEKSDEKAYSRKFVENDTDKLDPFGYESSMFGFELDPKKLGRTILNLEVPIMVKLYTSNGPIVKEFKVVVSE